MTCHRVVLEPWDKTFFAASNVATFAPIEALRTEDSGPRESELEIAYRMAEIYDDGPLSLACVHSCAIQVTLNLVKKITPYGNMARLKKHLEACGFVFEGGQVLPPG